MSPVIQGLKTVELCDTLDAQGSPNIICMVTFEFSCLATCAVPLPPEMSAHHHSCPGITFQFGYGGGIQEAIWRIFFGSYLRMEEKQCWLEGEVRLLRSHFRSL